MYINKGAKNGSEKLWTKNTATFSKLIIEVYASVVCQVDKSIIPYLLDQGVALWGAVSKSFGCKSVEDNADGLNV
jgi:hypothetical protein